ncbi:hypothetical protein GGR42_003086 [Saonia flava]|uniref:Lipocalin-like domain-containing protein n=1 Tax=Saonia flava TaxID=523696 RepID=A0A846R3Q0_9FLAO|nr:hypothetical protein [Saonia flava]NJB72595.1 hypothetical protein [Saonia flava]
MKRLLSLLAIISLFFASNCSRIPENNDPVLGIWSNKAVQLTTNKNSERLEWIFNDAYLGRYHRYNGNIVEMQTDFKWVQENGTYTISYPGTNLADDIVILKESAIGTVLEDNTGTILAKRE